MVINTWDTKWMEMMTNNNLTVITGIRYMDDIRAFLHAIRAGWRVWDGILCYCRWEAGRPEGWQKCHKKNC